MSSRQACVRPARPLLREDCTYLYYVLIAYELCRLVLARQSALLCAPHCARDAVVLEWTPGDGTSNCHQLCQVKHASDDS